MKIDVRITFPEGGEKFGKQVGGGDGGYAQIDDMFPGFREILQKIIPDIMVS